MDKKTKVGLGALVAVVVVVAAVVASDGTLFQGAFKGRFTGESIACYNARQACETGNPSRRAAQCANYVAQCGASMRTRCEQVLSYHRLGTISQLMVLFRSNRTNAALSGELNVCFNYAPEVFARAFATPELCAQYSAWRQQGILTQNLQGTGSVSEAFPAACAQLYPTIWNNPIFATVTEKRCRLLSTWSRQGVLTANGGVMGSSEYQNGCQFAYPVVFAEGLVNRTLCDQFAVWARKGILSTNLASGGYVRYAAQACQNLYPGIF